MDWTWQLEKIPQAYYVSLFFEKRPIPRFSPKEFLSAISPVAAIFVGLLKEIGWLSAESGGSLTFINEFQI